MKWTEKLSWPVIGILVATLGMAPYTPQPHVMEKLIMLFSGLLSKPIDIFDLVMHGTPWVLLFIKLAATFMIRGEK